MKGRMTTLLRASFDGLAAAYQSYRIARKAAPELNTPTPCPPGSPPPAAPHPTRGKADAEAAVPEELQRIIRPEAAMNWLSPMLASMTPERIESILRGALGGDWTAQWELFDLMEDTWPRLVKNLNEVKRAVQKVDFQFTPWAEEGEAPSAEAEERAKFVSRVLWRMKPDPARGDNAFEETIYDILDAWGKGCSVLELQWAIGDVGPDRGVLVPTGTNWVHPSRYAWGPDGSLGLVLPERGSALPFGSNLIAGLRSQVAPFPEHKFLICLARSKTGHPSRAALLRSLAWWWCAGNFAADWLLNFAQLFGLPIRWATYDASMGEGLLTKVCQMLENMGSAGWGAFPAGVTFELKEASKSGGGSDSPQGNMLDRADRNCDLLILGQTLTSDVGQQGSGSRALGEVHAGVRGDVIEAAADFVCRVINQQYIPAILMLNYGDTAECPWIGRKEIEDPRANAERDSILAKAGMVFPRKWWHERHNVPVPQDGEPVYGGSPAPAAEAGLGNDEEDGGSDLSEGADRTRKKIPSRASGCASLIREHFTGENWEIALRAKEVDAATNKQMESVSGVDAMWLAGLKPWYRELIEMAAESPSDAAFEEKLRAVVARSKEFSKDMFQRLDTAALADGIEGALGASVVNSFTRAWMRRRIGK